MTTQAPPRLLDATGRPWDFDPDIDAPLIGPTVLAAVGDSMGGAACSAWRVWQPFKHLQLHGYPCEWGFYEDPRTIGLLPAFDALIICRLGWTKKDRRSVRRQIDLWKRAGKRLFYECDDDLFSPFMVRQQKAGIAAEASVAELEQQRLDSLWTMQQCDGVTVSTQRLASVVRTFTDKPVAVIPNAIDVEWFRAVQKLGKRPVEGLTIGWAGGRRPDADLKEMAVAWGRIADRYPQVTFVVGGAQPYVISEHVPETRIKRLPWLTIWEYPMGLVGIDIGCCPLEDRAFNRCKCVVGDTLVPTGRGLIPISNLHQSRIPGIIIPLNMRVWTTEGWAMAEGFYYGGEQDTIRITTSLGFQIEGTLDHPIRRADDRWARLDELVVGDEVRIEPAVLSEKYVDVRFNPWAVRERHLANQDAVSLPTLRVDEHWGKALGYIIGDGHIGKNVVRVSCDPQDEDVVEDVTATLSALGLTPSSVRTRSRIKTGRGVMDVSVSSARFNDILELFGVHQAKRKAFAVPDVILRSPKPVVAAFLRALFESDGTVSASNSTAYFVTKDARLAREVQYLLSAFGVLAKVAGVPNARYGRDYYRVILRRAALDVFAEEIGFIGSRKNASLAVIAAKPHSNRYTPQRWADEVVKIERGRGEVFDVTVPGPAEFASGGFMSHNTPIKAWEYALSGAAVVASPTVYSHSIEPGRNGMLAQTADEWEEHLSLMVEQPGWRRGAADTLATDVVNKWSLKKNYRRWPEAWRRLIEEGA